MVDYVPDFLAKNSNLLDSPLATAHRQNVEDITPDKTVNSLCDT